MKIYETNAALGYQQLAYMVRLEKSENGYDYLCINTQNIYESDSYEPGKIVKDLEDFYVEESSFKIVNSSLYGTFLFDQFILNYDRIENKINNEKF